MSTALEQVEIVTGAHREALARAVARAVEGPAGPAKDLAITTVEALRSRDREREATIEATEHFKKLGDVAAPLLAKTREIVDHMRECSDREVGAIIELAAKDELDSLASVIESRDELKREFDALKETNRQLLERLFPEAERAARLARVKYLRAEWHVHRCLGEFTELLAASQSSGILAIEGIDAKLEIKNGFSSRCFQIADQFSQDAAAEEHGLQRAGA